MPWPLIVPSLVWILKLAVTVPAGEAARARGVLGAPADRAAPTSAMKLRAMKTVQAVNTFTTGSPRVRAVACLLIMYTACLLLVAASSNSSIKLYLGRSSATGAEAPLPGAELGE